MTPDSDQSNSDLIEIGRYSNLQHAELIKSVLESEQISAFVPDAHTTSILPHVMLNPTGGVRVLVTRENLERARQLISEIESAPIDSHPLLNAEPTVGKTYAKRFVDATILSVFVPLLANLWAAYCLVMALKEDKQSLLNWTGLITFAAFLLSSAVWIFVVYVLLT